MGLGDAKFQYRNGRLDVCVIRGKWAKHSAKKDASNELEEPEERITQRI